MKNISKQEASELLAFYALKYNGKAKDIGNASRRREPLNPSLYADLLERLGDFKITTIFDDDYPKFLANSPLRPMCIFTRGEFHLLSFLDTSIGIHAGISLSNDAEEDVYSIIQEIIERDVVFIHSSLYPLTHLMADAALDDAESFAPRIVVVPFCDTGYDVRGLVVSEVPFPNDKEDLERAILRTNELVILLSNRILLVDMEENFVDRNFLTAAVVLQKKLFCLESTEPDFYKLSANLVAGGLPILENIQDLFSEEDSK